MALSSGEAEYYVAVQGASEGLGFQSPCHELGVHFQQPDHVYVLTAARAKEFAKERDWRRSDIWKLTACGSRT